MSLQMEFVTDDLIKYDVAGVADYNNYFVFEDMLAETMLAFSRDPWSCSNSVTQSQVIVT